MAERLSFSLIFLSLVFFPGTAEAHHAPHFSRGTDFAPQHAPAFFSSDASLPFFISAGADLLNFYDFGKTDDGELLWTGGYLPPGINLEVRKNIYESGNDKSYSVALSPVAGLCFINPGSDLIAVANVPFFLQYNSRLGSTKRSAENKGISFSFGPAVNFMENLSEYPFGRKFISLDAQFLHRVTREDGGVRFWYARTGMEPGMENLSAKQFHINLGFGRFFG
ncbi:MAG TPA: hypothetical protein VFU15_12905 [Bacteroidia bacterium]|nr:hypothetical protein [Bacteroidia bacterium]